MSQYEFAEDCGISRTLLSLIETQKDNVTIDTMELLASYMGMTVSELFEQDITYFVHPSQIEIDGVEHTTYGIGALCQGVMVDCVPDILLDFDKIKELVYLCNSEGLELIHLRDVAENAVLDVG